MRTRENGLSEFVEIVEGRLNKGTLLDCHPATIKVQKPKEHIKTKTEAVIMSKKGHSSPNFWGGYTHYDDSGHKTGSSYPGFFGGYTHYDKNGHKSGHSSPGLFGGYSHYNSQGRKTGSSHPGIFGGYNHYDSSGRKSGGSHPGMFGSYHHNNTDGCYVATCVYGSYDCPQVWTLRRLRDDILAKNIAGRLFIRVYYAVSPTIVRWFGECKWFKTFWKTKLDVLVTKLRDSGVKDTPYQDKPWKS